MEEPEQLEAQLFAFGADHKRLGVEEYHYPIVTEVLILCLSRRVKGWSWAHEQAWLKLLDHISGVMIAGAAAERNVETDSDERACIRLPIQ